MYRIWCEWDCGQEDCIFTTKAKALAWLKSNASFLEAVEQEEVPFSEFVKNSGLVGFTKLYVDPA
jgi:hypothetical protein